MELHYARLLFTFTLTSDIADPHAFFATRAEFEMAFRNSLGCRRSDCTGCLSAAPCPFPATFGQQIANDPEAVRRHQKPPLPFIFQFPVLPLPPNSGKSFQLALHLVGSAVQHVSCYIAAVRVLVESKKGRVVNVEAEAPGGGVAPIDAAGVPLLSSQDPVLAGPLSTDTVTLQLLTPLKLVHEGRLLKNFTFAQFARSLMRRISSLAYHYEGAEPSLDYRWLSQTSEAVETLEYGCRLVSWNGRPAGIAGTAVFGGDLEPFHLLLQLGMATHLGKGASFGFGSYRVES
ncbi:CRISPR-associated endoribonuclease Cas6 [Citrifermentans bremense]|uniref:CRISPR-associated endoribonuclease Cas6 n=1 Tax=Citrifermentans bremense TaxID=60035 RepID=A0A6S6M1X8_9BACT|nr:CRISPR system precrRNA processing endoribonuclease RAMP protein Cas6 [Citrifermentans bremense]BCG48377.1 CRISPR-associated endoribonuclease Cas6 [Citrifermentans bremense]